MKGKLVCLALVAITLAAFGTRPAAAVLHFGLSRSAPAADSTVASVEEVRLWFTQAPADNSVGIRLIDASGGLVETADVAADAQDGKVFSVALQSPLPAGTYTVSWRGIGDDGHVARGDFGFSVAAH